MKIFLTRASSRAAAVLLAAALASPFPASAGELSAAFNQAENGAPAGSTPAAASVQTAEKPVGAPLISGETAAAFLLKNRQEDVIKRTPSAESDAHFPEKFDLRDYGYVTPVKLQNPWGTCWGFAAIAAAETSILSEMDKTYEETGLDLSEHHLTWFARSYLSDGSSQDGEGIYMFDNTMTLNTGGYPFMATSLFSSGIGVVLEDLIPYRGKNSKTDGFFGLNLSYSEDDDWSLPEEYKFLQSYELENSDCLLSPAVYAPMKDEGDIEARTDAYLGYDQSATDAMKQALMDGKAISVGFAADQFLPSDLNTDEEAQYLNVADDKWTHYTYDGSPATHAVTIVGWDDTVSRTDFLDHSGDQYGDGTPHQPEGDGAWIVKNSWGTETEYFPNFNSWGLPDENGKHSGYFYLSYYDRSISFPETFDFKTTENNKGGYIIDQYDYLQSDSVSGWLDETPLQMANVFTAEYDEVLTALSSETSTKNTAVTFKVYLLSEDAETPTEGTLLLTAEAEYEHAGYHRLYLEEPAAIAKGQRYSVVVTQRTRHEGKTYYGFSTARALNEEGTDDYNHRQKLLHTDDYLPYYAKGIVNPGESYVYIGALGAWSDFSEVIPALQENEDFSAYDFDNFPIKAYHDLQNESDAVFLSESNLPALNYAEPAGFVDVPLVLLEAAAVLLALALLIFLLIVLPLKNHKRKKRLKKLEAENAALRAKLEEMETSVSNAEEKTEASGTVSEKSASEA